MFFLACGLTAPTPEPVAPPSATQFPEASESSEEIEAPSPLHPSPTSDMSPAYNAEPSAGETTSLDEMLASILQQEDAADEPDTLAWVGLIKPLWSEAS